MLKILILVACTIASVSSFNWINSRIVRAFSVSEPAVTPLPPPYSIEPSAPPHPPPPHANSNPIPCQPSVPAVRAAPVPPLSSVSLSRQLQRPMQTECRMNTAQDPTGISAVWNITINLSDSNPNNNSNLDLFQPLCSV